MGKMYFPSFLLISACLLASRSFSVEARGTGAPFESCLLLTPNHASQPSQPLNTSPYRVSANSQFDESGGRESVLVTIGSKQDGSPTPFKGFVVQARFANNPDIIVDGTFVPNKTSVSHAYVCKPGEKYVRNNTWTHRHDEWKEKVQALWTPPTELNDDIVFVATVVMNKSTFWEGHKSGPVTVGSLINMDTDKEKEEDAKEENNESTELPLAKSAISSKDVEPVKTDAEEKEEKEEREEKEESKVDQVTDTIDGHDAKHLGSSSSRPEGGLLIGMVLVLCAFCLSF